MGRAHYAAKEPWVGNATNAKKYQKAKCIRRHSVHLTASHCYCVKQKTKSTSVANFSSVNSRSSRQSRSKQWSAHRRTHHRNSQA